MAHSEDAGQNRLPLAPKAGPVHGKGKFRNYDPGYVPIDVKHLPKLQATDGEQRKHFLYVAIDRCFCFTADAFEKACRDMTIDLRLTKAYSPQTNDMVERFNSQVTTDVL